MYLDKKKEYKEPNELFFCFDISKIIVGICTWCFFEANSVDPKYSLLWLFFLIKCYHLLIELITFRPEHGWNRLTFFFNFISQNLENLQHFVYRCHILSQCALRSGGEMFVAKVSINIWGHGYLVQEQFWKLINFRFFDCGSKKKFDAFILHLC